MTPMHEQFNGEIKTRLGDGVDEDGYVHDFAICTRNVPLEDVTVCSALRFVSIIGDDGVENVVIRVPFETLHILGCTDESIMAATTEDTTP